MIQNTDLFLVERAGDQWYVTADELRVFVGAVADLTAIDITDRNTNFSSAPAVKQGDRIFVTDASGDPEVNSGWAVYRVESLAPAVYNKMQEQEGLDIVIAPTNMGYVASPTGGQITSSTGSPATIPLVSATNAGLASPGQLEDFHKPALAGKTPTTNPVVVDSTTQEISFSISQLAPLP